MSPLVTMGIEADILREFVCSHTVTHTHMPTDRPTHSASRSFLAPIASQVAFPPVSCWCSCWKNSPMPSAVVMIPYIPRFVCQILHLITLSFCDAGVIINDCTAERWDVSGVIEALKHRWVLSLLCCTLAMWVFFVERVSEKMVLTVDMLLFEL